MNCVLYARVSTDKQADKELSIPAQLQAMRDYARQHEWRVAHEFIEAGASAKTTDRRVLQDLLARIKDGEPTIDVVLVHKIDRLARNVYDHATIKSFLTQHEVRLASVVENVDDSVSGQLVENIMASLAQFYSANLADEVRKGMRQKVLKGGWPHKPPRGYVVVKNEGGRADLEIHPREGPLMRRAFELYATGWYSMRSVANRLAKEGLVAGNGNAIPQAHIRRLLSNPFYVGRVRWQDLEAQGKHPPLVSDALFAKVQNTIRERYRDPGVKGSLNGFPLRGLALCAHCRGRMSAERHRRWSYYRCSRRSYRREKCPSGYCNAAKAHSGLERVCKQIRLSQDIADRVLAEASRLIADRTAQAVTHSERRRTRLANLLKDQVQLAEAFTAEDVAPKAFVAKAAKLREAKSRVEDDINRSVPNADDLFSKVAKIVQIATSLWDLYERLDDFRRADFLRSVFKSVILDHDGIAGFTLKSPFDALAVPPSARPMSPRDQAEWILRAA
jgi:site-specific DNA recombinase